MASALDEDTQQSLAEGQETARSFLRSVQKDLQKVFIFFLVAFIGTFYALRLYVWDALKAVTSANMPPEIEQELEIIAQTPFEVILLQAKIGMIIGAIVSIPPLIWFGRDGLKERDMWPSTPISPWKIIVLGVTSAILFTVGAAYGYFIFFPVMFNFLASFGLEAGFNPSYSIVMWTEFIVFLSLSFGLAGQMPLLITGLSYAEIVPYETFRDKWRYAVVAIFVFGAMFSPPDPFTQIMWAVPLLSLYAFSLYLAKVVVTAKRSSDQINVLGSVREYWNVVAGAAILGGAVSYAFYEYGGRTLANDALRVIGTTRRFLPAGDGLGLAPGVAIGLYSALLGLLFALVAVLYVIYSDLEMTGPDGKPPMADPAAIDVDDLDAAGVRAAPPQAFAAMTEEESLKRAEKAMNADDPEKAQAILDRFDEAEAAAEEAADGEEAGADGETAGAENDVATTEGGVAADEGGVTDEVGDRASRASSTFLEELTEDDGEDDIGGYYTDLKFVVDSLRSGSFRIVATFMAVMAGTFTWMYLGGLGDVRQDFISRVPPTLETGDFTVITLHPVEALIFMVKFSVLIGLIAVLPMLAYYAWPALRDRGFVRGHQRQVYIWTGSLAGALIGGFALGYFYLAPGLISYLVTDALNANMLITYRINDFFWLIIFTTIGIGFLADVPILMILLNSVGVPYAAFRRRWREVTLAMLTFAAIFTPADIITMILVTVPLMAAYGVGLAALYVVTLGGRRDLAPPADIITDGERLQTKVEDRL